MADFEPNDQHWQQIEVLLSPVHSGKHGCPCRLVINGVLWIFTTGTRWIDLPDRYRPWQNDLLAGEALGLRQSVGQSANLPGRNRLPEMAFRATDSTMISGRPIAATCGHYAEEDDPVSDKIKPNPLDVVAAGRQPRSAC